MLKSFDPEIYLNRSTTLNILERLLQGVKLTCFPCSHLAPKYCKVVANSKKLVAMTHTQKHFYSVIVLDRLNCKEDTRMNHIQCERLPKCKMCMCCVLKTS